MLPRNGTYDLSILTDINNNNDSKRPEVRHELTLSSLHLQKLQKLKKLSKKLQKQNRKLQLRLHRKQSLHRNPRLSQ